MSQIFPRSANVISRLTLVGLALAVPLLIGMWALYNQSSPATGAGRAIEQPIPFSHLIHAGRLNIDCRYCHTSAETSPFAGMPATSLCMNCHSKIMQGLPAIEELAASQKTGIPIAWQRVYNLPDYVYFNHSAHVNKGVACETCHGRVDQMSVISQAAPLTMDWCLSCHRAPANNLRPESAITTMGWSPDSAAPISGAALMKTFNINTQPLTECYTCHR